LRRSNTPKAAIVHCYVVHLGLFESGRGRQNQALIDCVNKSAPNGEPVIIAGDFNDWRNTLSDKLRNALGVVEVFDELGSALQAWATWCATWPAARSRVRAGAHLSGGAALVPPRPDLCARLQGRYRAGDAWYRYGPSCRTTRRSWPTSSWPEVHATNHEVYALGQLT
jgi:hypothetical protein